VKEIVNKNSIMETTLNNNKAFFEQIRNSISKLNYHQQIKLVDFINSFSEKDYNPKNLIKFSKAFDKQDLKLMEKAINEDCNSIYNN